MTDRALLLFVTSSGESSSFLTEDILFIFNYYPFK